MASYLDAVFAYFGDDEPSEELRAVLFGRIEPTDEELEEILGSNDGSADGKTYCQRVHDALLSFCADPATYAAGLSDDNPRKLGLAVLAEIHSISKAVVQRALVEKQEPVQKPAEKPVAGVDPMLSGVVRVAQPPRTTPVRTTTAVDKPADGPPEETHSGDDNMGNKRGKQQGDAQQDRRRLTPTELVTFFEDPDAFIAKMSEEAIEGRGLTELLAAVKAKKAAVRCGINPITREMSECAQTTQWKGIFVALLDAYLREDDGRISTAKNLRDCYLSGTYGADRRVLGALMRACIRDIENQLNFTDPKEFKRRYNG